MQIQFFSMTSTSKAFRDQTTNSQLVDDTQLRAMLIEIALNRHLTQLLAESTRDKNDIDPFFTNCQLLIDKIEVKPGIGDHEAVIAHVIFKSPKIKKAQRSVYQYAKADLNGFSDRLTSFANSLIPEVLQDLNAGQLWNDFKSTITSY